MKMTFRQAERSDVARIVELLADDAVGQGREVSELATYLRAFDKMRAEPGNTIIVGEGAGGEVMATYQLTFISSISRSATRRAQIEAVRVDASLRGQGFGAMMMKDAEERARAAGCGLMQLTTDATRERAQAFYKQIGFTASHVGFKRSLSDD